MRKCKKMLAMLMVISMMASWSLAVSATDKQPTEDVVESLGTQGFNVLTKEEYIENYAILHNLSYSEAETMDALENKSIWEEYYAKNNMVQPRTITYQDYDSSSGTKIWRVKAESTYKDNIATVTYGAQGKLIVDTHSRTFVKGSFKSNSYYMCGSGNYNLASGYSLYVDDGSYTSLYISLVGNIEIAVSYANSIGASYLVSYGYTQTTTGYWRKSISPYFKETL